MSHIIPILLSVVYINDSSVTATAAQEVTNATTLTNEMTLVKTGPAQQLVAHSLQGGLVTLFQSGTNEIVPVNLFAHTYEFTVAQGHSANRTLKLVEFQVKSSKNTDFSWCCWDSVNSYPHNFKLFCTTVMNYACYSSSDGIKLFRLSGTNNSESARNLFLEHQRGLGELKPLSNGVLHDLIGAEHFYGVNALYWTIFIDQISEVDGGLRVTIHGDNPNLQFTLQLKGEQWENVSTSNK